VMARHYPNAAASERPYRALLQTVIDGTAELIASWQLIGFIHGVMNTDNTSIAGETIDYGPCAFMDTFHPATVYSYDPGCVRTPEAPKPREWLSEIAQN
jgi:serine/tyrosine/threonine adenylyltransferase